jgi:hypothetical protein
VTDTQEVPYSDYIECQKHNKILAEERKDGCVFFSTISDETIKFDDDRSIKAKVIGKKKARIPDPHQKK